jgi:hypothetical protein
MEALLPSRALMRDYATIRLSSQSGGTSMNKGERGGISVGLIITLLLGLFLVYEATKFGPLLIAQFQFQDAVIEAAKFSRGKEANAVQAELLQRAGELQLPITRDMIKVLRQPTNTRIQISYELQTEWMPGRIYKWKVDLDEESMLF